MNDCRRAARGLRGGQSSPSATTKTARRRTVYEPTREAVHDAVLAADTAPAMLFVLSFELKGRNRMIAAVEGAVRTIRL